MSNSRTLHPEDQIAQYRVVGPLGAGGMGEVYLAQDQSLERSVALKVLPNDLTRSDDRVRRFVQEAKSASSLNHPNIVTIYEIGQEPVKNASGGGTDSGPLHYISMELISGKTLGAKIHEEKADLKSLVGYLAQAAEGIAKAHAVGIVHRDLKPGNIMVTDDGYAKVLDFGLAKLTEKTSGPNEATEIADRTSEGAVMGTISYMSPEQVQGKPVDARADVFAFGSILYEAATRQRPFVADSNVEIMHKILHEKPRPVEELNPQAPAELRRVIRRCLAKQPEQRAQSMKDVAIELREVFDEYDSLSASATSATLTAAGGVMPLSSRRRKSLWPVIAVGAAAAAIAAFIWVGVLHRGEKNASDNSSFANMRINAQTNRGDVTDCAISPDGRYIAYIAGRNNQNSLRVRQVATGSDVEILPVQDANMEFPSFSPDGNYIYYCKRKADAPNYRVLMSVPPLLRIHASHGFAVETLHHALGAAGILTELRYCGSVEAVASLHSGGCELAGFHLPVGEFESAAVAHYAPWLKPASQRLIGIATRRLGLMVARGDPKKIYGIRDLARPDVRFINRQSNSGTRFLLDLMLHKEGIASAQVHGYEQCEMTHAAVAACVASGMADVGFGVETPARRFKLDFVPIVTERYFLLCDERSLESAVVRSMLGLIQGAEFKDAVNRLPGYQADDTTGVVTGLRQTLPTLRARRH